MQRTAEIFKNSLHNGIRIVESLGQLKDPFCISLALPSRCDLCDGGQNLPPGGDRVSENLGATTVVPKGTYSNHKVAFNGLS